MLVEYPKDWEKHMKKGKTRTFLPDTPKSIIEEAKKIDDRMLEYTGKHFFSFDATI